MENDIYSLTMKTRASLAEVVESLMAQKSGTDWAAQTNKYAINYAKELGAVYGDAWYTGLLPQELFNRILLPQHEHMIHIQKNNFIFPLDTPITSALSFYEQPATIYAEECMTLVQSLKDSIQKNGFTTSITLAVINGTLKHVDGLHRMLALTSLLEEGYEYKPIPVYLCDNTKI